MERTEPQPATYARALRLVAVATVLVVIAKHLTTDVASPVAQRELLIVRGIGAAVVIALALVCSPRRSTAELRGLAFAYGIAVVFLTAGVATVLPQEVWEQSVSLVAVMLGAAVFMPWSWRWQAAFVGIALGAVTITFALGIPRSALDGHSIVRVLLTLYVMGALSVVGADVADRARRQIQATQAERRTTDQQHAREQQLDALGRFAGGIAHQFTHCIQVSKKLAHALFPCHPRERRHRAG